MKISIVIPVYNEGEHLAACLDAIACQSVPAYEVIVVNNNSSDNTVAVAERYKFVKIIHEPRQGVVHARNTGFNATKGDVIGRIDADTIVSTDWVFTLKKLFSDGTVDALSGAVTYHDLPWKRFVGWLDLSLRQWIANGMGREVFLYGANMAIRKSAWIRVRAKVCKRAGLHEDFDLAIHSAETNLKVIFDSRLKAAVSLRRFDTKFLDFVEYAWLNPAAYRQHHKHSQTRMYPVVTLVVCSYFLIRLIYQSYNPEDDSLSLLNIFNTRSALRVNPATFVD